MNTTYNFSMSVCGVISPYPIVKVVITLKYKEVIYIEFTLSSISYLINQEYRFCSF